MKYVNSHFTFRRDLSRFEKCQLLPDRQRRNSYILKLIETASPNGEKENKSYKNKDFSFIDEENNTYFTIFLIGLKNMNVFNPVSVFSPW